MPSQPISYTNPLSYSLHSWHEGSKDIPPGVSRFFLWKTMISLQKVSFLLLESAVFILFCCAHHVDFWICLYSCQTAITTAHFPAFPDYLLVLLLLFCPQIAGPCALRYCVSQIAFFMPPQVVAPWRLETSFSFLWFIIVSSTLLFHYISRGLVFALRWLSSSLVEISSFSYSYRCAKA